LDQSLTRRDLVLRAGGGMGVLALADLFKSDGTLTAAPKAINPLAPKAGHYPAKAKAVIWLFMEGAPSAVDLFDPKPELQKNHGKKIEINVFFGDPGPLMKSPFSFKQYGECGQWVSEHYTSVAKHVDDLAFIKSCYSESDNHVPALYQINTGIPRPGFPSAGAWITYGLGSENQNLPGYVVLGNTQGVKGGPHNWSAGFLPSTYQGTLFRTQGNPILISTSTPAKRNFSPACNRLNLLTACRPKPPMLWICPRNPKPCTPATAWTIPSRSRSARSA
jgi:hypothetical protein